MTDTGSTVPAGQPGGDALVVQDLAFAWPGKPPLLQIDSLRLGAGRRALVLGPSGCGKSTLLNLLAGVLRPASGTIEIDGHDLTAMSSAARDRFRADRVGYLFQQFNLLAYLDVLHNVLLPLRFSPRRREALVAAGQTAEAQAATLLEALGLPSSMHGQRAATLSVGQQQRVAAARALLGNPALVLADEPTSALDSGHRRAFLDALDSVCRPRVTQVLVSHDESLAAQCDDVIDLAALQAAGRHPAAAS